MRVEPDRLRRWTQERRIKVFAHYCPEGKIECACCGCPLVEYLTIDFIAGNDSKHRKNSYAYGNLINAGYPQGYQILCTLCNNSKGNKKVCTYHDTFPRRNWAGVLTPTNMDEMSKQANENRNQIDGIRARFLTGVITEDEARKEAKPVIDRMNEAGAQLAKEYGMRFKKLTFAYLMR